MRFVLRMAWRETRASWLRLVFFFVCVALGVAAIVVLRSVVQNVRETLTREARQIVGADVVVQSPRPWTREILGTVDRLTADSGVLARTEVIETRTMAASVPGGDSGKGRVKLVELRGVEDAFPFYGAISLEGGQAYSSRLLENHGTLVPPEFLAEMGLAVGDTVRLGGTPFTVRGVVREDRVQRGGGGFAFGPRLYVSLGDLRGLGLLGFGSSATYQIYLRIEESAITGLTTRLRSAFEQQTVSVRSWRAFEDRLGRNLTTAENYLSLVGFAMVVLGGIGVWSVTRVIVQQKVKSVAILKCLGASSRAVLGTYVTVVLWLASAGSALGLGLALAVVRAVPAAVLQPLGITAITVTVSAAAQGVLVGLLVSLLFALVPLLEMRRVKPLLLLRADTAGSARKPDRASRLAGAATAAALMLVAVWQAGSVRAGVYVSLGLGASALLLMLAARLLVWMTSRLAASRVFAVRHAIISLARPGNQTRVILIAVGLGAFFVISIRSIQANLLAEFTAQIGQTSPDLVLIDIQRDQVQGVDTATRPYVLEPIRTMPLMRARVVGVDGRRARLPTPDAVRQQGRLTREFGVTYRDHLQPNETVVAGDFWAAALPAAPEPDVDTEVSISEEVKRDADVDVGDLVRLDVAGQVIRTRVTSIRRVAWDETQNGGFFFVLRPAPVIDRLPHAFVGFLRTGDDPATRAGVQRAVVDGFPNVSAIDVRAVVASIRSVLDNITLGVTIVGAITLMSGVLILVGAVAMTKFQRVYETAIYRTLGASARLVAATVAVEYGVLGLLAGIVASVGALGLSWAIARFLLEIPWRPEPGILVAGAAGTAALVCTVGVLASVDVLLRKPLGALRETS
ncbi:MAG TPA: FtsX-like permease family protein [Vicinamibacterales bacterium]|nr:FtsX-like permease family protein [Vicinamibacterales bacterium]